MEIILSVLFDIIILGVFAYYSLVVAGIVKLKPERQEKMNDLIQRKGKWVKLFVYGGTVLFLITIILNINMYKRRQPPVDLKAYPVKWTEADKKEFTQSCILNAKQSYMRNPKKTEDLCKCVTEKFVAKYSYSESKEMTLKSEKEQLEMLQPLIMECMADTLPSN